MTKLCACLFTIAWTYLTAASETCSQIDGGGALMQRGHPNLLDRRSGDKKDRSARSGGKAILEGALIQEPDLKKSELYNIYKNTNKSSASAAEKDHGKEEWIFEGKDSPGSWGSGRLVNDQHGIVDTEQDGAGRQAGFGGPDSSQINSDMDDLIVEPETAKSKGQDGARETGPAGVDTENQWQEEVHGTHAEQSASRQFMQTKDDLESSQAEVAQDGHEDASVLRLGSIAVGTHDRGDRPAGHDLDDPAQGDIMENSGRLANGLSGASAEERQMTRDSSDASTEALNAGQREEFARSREAQNAVAKARMPSYSPNGYSPIETNTAPKMQTGSADNIKPYWMTGGERVPGKGPQGISTGQSFAARVEQLSARSGDVAGPVKQNVTSKGKVTPAGDAAAKEESNAKSADSGNRSAAPGTRSAANPSILESRNIYEKDNKLAPQSRSSPMFPGNDPDWDEIENETVSSDNDNQMDGYYRNDNSGLDLGAKNTWSRRGYGIHHQQKSPKNAALQAHGVDVAKAQQHPQNPPPMPLPKSFYEAPPRAIATELASTTDHDMIFSGSGPVDDDIEAELDNSRLPAPGMVPPLQQSSQYGRFPANDPDNEDNDRNANVDAESEDGDDYKNDGGKVIYASKKPKYDSD